MRQGQRSKQEWAEIVEDFKKSGKNKSSYCRVKDLKYHTFKYWYYRLSDKNGHDKAEQEKSGDFGRVVEEAQTGFTRLKVIGSDGVLLPDNDPSCEEARTREQVSTIKLVLRSGIKLELETSNILELIRELNYVA